MYLPYEPLSKKNDASAFVPPELAEAQQFALNSLPKKLKENWDEWVASKLSITKDKLWEVFSSEQIDSIGITINNFENGKNFIIGDETGIGKGRILSGICKYAFSQGKRVLFFTEREHLFSDFWRDLTDTDTLPLLKEPVVFHSKTKVYNPDGEAVLKGTMKIVKQIQENGFHPDTNLVMTNYSQISLKQHKKTKKDLLVEFCKDNIVILDESHNATGDSNTKKFLLTLIEECQNIVYSSATYIKDESQLELYEKTIDFDAETIKMFKKLLKNDQETTLRKIFTYELTRKLQFWRREHQPLNVGWKTVICENDDKNSIYLDEYSSIINGLFQVTNNLSKQPNLSSLNLTSSWFNLGATINRLSRNLLLLLKVDTLIESVEKSLANDHKAVVVIDSTFASIIQKVIDHQAGETDDEETDNLELPEGKYELNFKQVLHYIIDEVAGKYIEEYDVEEDTKLAIAQLKERAFVFQDLFISPIDSIINRLQEKGIACNEISGRTWRVNKDGLVEKIQKLPKPKLVASFNSGETNVIIITRAGASGISLHASASFKDQRVRDLYELEITNRPTYRLQFIGRVNRKNQVKQPEFFTVITKLPFEQRILNVEQQKLKTLQSHISGDDEKLDQENIFNFYTEYCNMGAYMFLKNHPFIAFQMGISMKGEKEDLYYIDSILKRCIVLSVEQQNFLYDYLIYCTQAERKLTIRKNSPYKVVLDSIKTFWHHLDKKQQEGFRTHYGNFPQFSINQFNYPWVGLMKAVSSYKTDVVFSMNLKRELQENMQHSGRHAGFLKDVVDGYYKNPDMNRDYITQVAAPLLRSLQVGKCITIRTIEGNIFGYVHNIEFPSIPKVAQYDSACLIHIKTINPHLHDSIFYAPSDYFLTLRELIESENITIHDTPIDWSKFERPAREYQRMNYYMVGHPVYMEFLRQAYQVGEIRYFDIAGRKNMCIMMPSGLKESQLLSMKKPIYQANKIMEGLICKNIKRLTTVWQDEKEFKPTLKIEPTTGGYNLFIAQEVAKDPKLMDFPFKKKLKDFRGRNNGYELYMIPYKEIRVILLMLESRDVVWFTE